MPGKNSKTAWIAAFVVADVLLLGAWFWFTRGPGGNQHPPPPAGAAAASSNRLAHPAPASAALSGASTNQALADRLRALGEDTPERSAEIGKIAAGIPAKERPAALDRLWQENSPASRELVQRLIRDWAAEAPELAASWLLSKPPSVARHEASVAIATVWAGRSPADAADWVRQWPEDEQPAGLLAVAYEAVSASPKEALWLASELPPTEARNGLVSHAVREWASQEPEGPKTWAEKMEPSFLRDQVYANISIALSETDPSAAGQMAIEKIPPGEGQNSAVVSIVQRWAQQQPEQAADWVARFPEGELRETAIENLVQVWTGQKPDGAAGWLNQLEQGPLRDTAISAYTGEIASANPASALRWASEITDPLRRERESNRLLERWMEMDSDAAAAWIEASALAGQPLPDTPSDTSPEPLALP